MSAFILIPFRYNHHFVQCKSLRPGQRTARHELAQSGKLEAFVVRYSDQWTLLFPPMLGNNPGIKPSNQLASLDEPISKWTPIYLHLRTTTFAYVCVKSVYVPLPPKVDGPSAMFTYVSLFFATRGSGSSGELTSLAPSVPSAPELLQNDVPQFFLLLPQNIQDLWWEPLHILAKAALACAVWRRLASALDRLEINDNIQLTCQDALKVVSQPTSYPLTQRPNLGACFKHHQELSDCLELPQVFPGPCKSPKLCKTQGFKFLGWSMWILIQACSTHQRYQMLQAVLLCDLQTRNIDWSSFIWPQSIHSYGCCELLTIDDPHKR
ncbi:hypothetical protein C8R45DRAFT_1082083 [Mycena sanguinolenta]|nr:hypothetical protein C8R45DRAFT_1082083 [Mycena sanguinolenta]